MSKFKLGDIVKSKWNSYGDFSCIVDRVYTRKDKQKMVRLKFYIKGIEKLINVPENVCEFDVSRIRDEKLKKLFNEKNED